MREPRPHWLAMLRALEGCAEADIRYNEEVGRWEFILPSADGKMRSQFWGVFHDARGRWVPPDPVTGLHPFRELDDQGMREAIASLERTYVANRHDGAGSTRREVRRRMAHNAAVQRAQYRAAGELFADMVMDRGRRLRGGALIQVPITLHKGS